MQEVSWGDKMRGFSFYDKEKNKNTLDTLANALNNRKQTKINTGSITATPQQKDNSDEELVNGAFRFGKGLYNLYNKGKENGYFNFGNNSGPTTFSMNDYTSAGGNGGFNAIDNLSFTNKGGGLDNLSFMGSSNAGGVDNLSFANLGESAGSAAGSSGGFKGFGNFGGGSGGGAPWGAIAGFVKQGYNGLTGKNEADYSDTEQTVAYPLQGAAMGSSFGPWGALGGALYGLGYSFKDDIGLGDNELLTDLIFPIGMGDEHQGLIRM